MRDGDITDDFINDATKTVLLSVEDTKIWLDHLLSVLQSRKRGAAKAAATRRMKCQQQSQKQSEHLQSLQMDSSKQQSPKQSGQELEKECYCRRCSQEYSLCSKKNFGLGVTCVTNGTVVHVKGLSVNQYLMNTFVKNVPVSNLSFFFCYSYALKLNIIQ